MPRMEFEPTIPALERAKTVHALDRPATVNGSIPSRICQMQLLSAHFEKPTKSYLLNL
jgi:hypothetical protein